MLKTIVKKGSYQDSVVLMLLTNKISTMNDVNKVSIMMATPANKEIFTASGLNTPELMEASANDMVIVVDTDNEAMIDEILEETDSFIKNQASASKSNGEQKEARSWDQALEKQPDANLAVISIPGAYAAIEANRALDENLSVFMFSDNVSKEDERALKEKAHAKGLLVMGPDCGTGIIQGVPIAFTNHVAPGSIGIIGASGTGIQELTSIIDRLGEGVTNAIGTGGRDLSSEIGGITMMDTINAMENDESVQVVIVISKPPAKEVRQQITRRLANYRKTVVTLFLGEKPTVHEKDFYHAYTLDEAARIAVSVVRGKSIKQKPVKVVAESPFSKADRKTIKGYYSGGTLASEAAMLMKDAMGISACATKVDGFMLKNGGHIVIDLGDDVYTQGKPHPMIDPTKRAACMAEAMDDESTGVILFDLVLGYGSHENMAGALLDTILSLKEKADQNGRRIHFVATVCGTRKDIQNYDQQVKIMEDAGVVVCESNKRAVETALYLIGYPYQEKEKEIVEIRQTLNDETVSVPENISRLLQEKPKVINLGLRSFTKVLQEFSCEVTQYDWQPPAGGDLEMIQALEFLRGYQFS